MIITLRWLTFLVDEVRNGVVYMRPVRDDVAYLPGVRVDLDDLLQHVSWLGN